MSAGRRLTRDQEYWLLKARPFVACTVQGWRGGIPVQNLASKGLARIERVEEIPGPYPSSWPRRQLTYSLTAAGYAEAARIASNA